MSMSGSSSADDSSPARAARRKRPASDVPTREQQETCFYRRHSDTTRCLQPRPCRECLEMEGCMINQFGQCVNMTIDGYNPWMDFHVGITMQLHGPGFTNPIANTTLQQYHFPAHRAAYCVDRDPVCDLCKQQAFSTRDTRFCVGADGCLCIAACELPTWETDIGGRLRCSEPPSLSSSSSSHVSASLADLPIQFKSASLYPSLYIAIAALIVSIATITLDRRRTLKLFRMYHTQGMVAMPTGNGRISIVAATPPLNLFGWRDHLQELIDKEQLLLAGCEDLSPVSLTSVDFFVCEPSAPVDVESSAGTAPVANDDFINASGPILTPVLPSAPAFDDGTGDETHGSCLEGSTPSSDF